MPRPRRRRHYAVLDRELIAEAALAVIQRDGLDALTMRTLAAQLKVSAAALYHHVASRSDLLLLAADGLLAIPAQRTPLEEAQAIRRAVTEQRDGRRLLTEVSTLRRSRSYLRISAALEDRDLAESILTLAAFGPSLKAVELLLDSFVTPPLLHPRPKPL